MARRDRAASERRAFATRAAAARTAPAVAGIAPLPGQAAPSSAPSPLPSAPELQLVQGALGLAAAPAEVWLALHLPALVVESLTRRAVAGAASLAIFEAEGGLSRVVAVDATARARGVVPGLTLAASLALEPALDARPRQPGRERALLARLAEAGCAFTPRVSLEPPDGVLLEVRGSLGLFGGTAALCGAVAARCAALGITARLALAPTPLAALALARAGVALAVTGNDRLVGALSPLPLAVLRWAPQALARLESMGVRTLGEALRLPRAGFARRFGRGTLEDLDRLVGRRPDLRRPYVARETFRGRCEPAFELSQHDAILRHVEPLLAELEGFLRTRQAAVSLLQLRLQHRPDPRGEGCPRFTPLELRLAAPEFVALRFAALLGEHLARLQLPAPVIAFELRSGELLPLALHSESLWRAGEHGGGAARESPALIERLRARLGPGSVHGLCLVAEHRPEHSWQAAEPSLPAGVSAGTAAHVSQDLHAPDGLRRPLWLLKTPERFPAGLSSLRLLEGPERIETGWWDGRDIARDYYTALDAGSALLWVFRERLPPHDWYLHGVFG